MSKTKIIGERGEDAAVEFLERKGFEILERNFRTPWGEIDIVASRQKVESRRERGEIVFVEVKTRTSCSFGLPEEAMDFRKLLRLNKAVRMYVAKHKWIKSWRMDFIGVALDNTGGVRHIEHMEDIEVESRE